MPPVVITRDLYVTVRTSSERPSWLLLNLGLLISGLAWLEGPKPRRGFVFS